MSDAIAGYSLELVNCEIRAKMPKYVPKVLFTFSGLAPWAII